MKQHLKQYLSLGLSLGASLATSITLTSCDDGDTIVTAGETNVKPTTLENPVPEDLRNLKISSFKSFGDNFPYFLQGTTFISDTQLADNAYGQDFQFDSVLRSANTLTLKNFTNIAELDKPLPTQAEIDDRIVIFGQAQVPGSANGLGLLEEATNPISIGAVTGDRFTSFEEAKNSFIYDIVGDLIEAYNNNISLRRHAVILLAGNGDFANVEVVPQGEADAASEMGIDGTEIVVFDDLGDDHYTDITDFNLPQSIVDLYNETNTGEEFNPGSGHFVGYTALAELIEQENGSLTGDLGDKIVATKNNLEAFIKEIDTENALIKERVDELMVTQLARVMVFSDLEMVMTFSNAFANDDDFIFEFNFTTKGFLVGAEAFILTENEDGGFRAGEVRVKPSTKKIPLNYTGVGELQRNN